VAISRTLSFVAITTSAAEGLTLAPAQESLYYPTPMPALCNAQLGRRIMLVEHNAAPRPRRNIANGKKKSGGLAA
jgi:hypothetical protein